MHMCTISVDRYIGIRDPFVTHSRNRTTVAAKIAYVWLISFGITLPVAFLGYFRPGDVLNEDQVCAIMNRHFLIYGSLSAFFVPLIIMLVTYPLSIRLLSIKSRKLSSGKDSRPPDARLRRSTTAKEKTSDCARVREKRIKINPCSSGSNSRYFLQVPSVGCWTTNVAEKNGVHRPLSRTGNVGSRISRWNQQSISSTPESTQLEISVIDHDGNTCARLSDSSASPTDFMEVEKEGNTDARREIDPQARNKGHNCELNTRGIGWNRKVKRLVGSATKSSPSCQELCITPLEEGDTTLSTALNTQTERRDKFKKLVQKHSAALRMAGMLIVKRDDQKRKALNRVKSEQKAARVLGTMFAIFVFSWGPFFCANLATGVFHESVEISPVVFRTFLWLGYVSSTLNPMVYTVFNRTFRRTFANILRICAPKNK